MSQNVFLTREPVVNKQRAITATRMRVHAPDCATAVHALEALGEDWPLARPVFVGLAGCTPDATLADWIAPEGAMLEVNAPSLADPVTAAAVASWPRPACRWCCPTTRPASACRPG
jgi:EAL and modified HD-GYP domain-containing signal transduction protein